MGARIVQSSKSLHQHPLDRESALTKSAIPARDPSRRIDEPTVFKTRNPCALWKRSSLALRSVASSWALVPTPSALQVMSCRYFRVLSGTHRDAPRSRHSDPEHMGGEGHLVRRLRNAQHASQCSKPLPSPYDDANTIEGFRAEIYGFESWESH